MVATPNKMIPTPDSSSAITELVSRANQLIDQNHCAQAEPLLRRALQQDPDNHVAAHGMGVIASKAGNMELAARYMARAIVHDRLVALYHRNISEVLRQLGRLDRAVDAANNAIKLSPNDAEAHYNLGLAEYDRNNHDIAVRAYSRTIELNPRHKFALNNLGNLYSQLGNMERATATFEQAIRSDPRHIDPHYNVSALKKYTPDDAQFAQLKSLQHDINTFSHSDQVKLLFALGKAWQDCGDIEQAMMAFTQGNRLQYKDLNFDEKRSAKQHAAIPNKFSKVFLESRHGMGNDSEQPVFILGMPRSGTTLVEQILASHPDFCGAGEIEDLSLAVQHVLGNDASQIPVDQISQQQFRQMGDNYIERIARYSGSAARISNKMPANYQHIGLLKIILPKAKIIHLVRDPMDACLSCYTRLFSDDNMAFTYDLEILGRYCSRYLETMQHWQQTLPRDAVLHVRYADLVNDFENQARRMIDFIGLPWHASCLDFHNSDRGVRTASLSQVRKPIYSSSVSRWKPYAAHLQPLLETLRDHRDIAFD